MNIEEELITIIHEYNELLLNVAKQKGFTSEILPYLMKENRRIDKMINKMIKKEGGGK